MTKDELIELLKNNYPVSERQEQGIGKMIQWLTRYINDKEIEEVVKEAFHKNHS